MTRNLNLLCVSNARARSYLGVLICWAENRLLPRDFFDTMQVASPFSVSMYKALRESYNNPRMLDRWRGLSQTILTCPNDQLDTMINVANLKLTIELDGYQTLIGIVPDSWENIPLALAAILRLTHTDAGLSWIDMIGQCEWCSGYFVRKTRKKCKFCSTKCRWTYGNSNRKNR